MLESLKNNLSVYVGGRRWMKRKLHPWLPREVYCQAEGLKIFVNTMDYRGPSYALMNGGSKNYWGYEAEVKKEIMDRLPNEGAIFFDIGANIGLYSLYAFQHKKNLSAYLIEPNPSLINCIRKTIEANDISGLKTFQRALSSRSGKETFFLDALNDGGHSLLSEQIEDQKGMEQTTVEVTTLDTIVKEENLSALHGIKIDVQGAEHLVLQGAKVTLEKFAPPLLIEVDTAAVDMKDGIIEILASLYNVNYHFKRIGVDECRTLEELPSFTEELHKQGAPYQDYLFFNN